MIKSFKVCGLSNALHGTENNLIRCAKEIPEFNIRYGVSAEESDEDIFADTDEQDEEDDEQDKEDEHDDEKEYKEDKQHEEDDEENDCEHAYVHLRWVYYCIIQLYIMLTVQYCCHQAIQSMHAKWRL